MTVLEVVLAYSTGAAVMLFSCTLVQYLRGRRQS